MFKAIDNLDPKPELTARQEVERQLSHLRRMFEYDDVADIPILVHGRIIDLEKIRDALDRDAKRRNRWFQVTVWVFVLTIAGFGWAGGVIG